MNIQCPVCNEQLEDTQTECPRCGFKLIGKTQTFTPVTDGSDGTSAPVHDGTAALEIVTGPYAGELFKMGRGTFTLGRDPGCDVFLSNMTVSRHHATIHVDEHGARIADAGSLNGTWVDGAVVEQAELVAGTHVQIGTFNMVFKYLVGEL